MRYYHTCTALPLPSIHLQCICSKSHTDQAVIKHIFWSHPHSTAFRRFLEQGPICSKPAVSKGTHTPTYSCHLERKWQPALTMISNRGQTVHWSDTYWWYRTIKIIRVFINQIILPLLSFVTLHCCHQWLTFIRYSPDGCKGFDFICIIIQ